MLTDRGRRFLTLITSPEAVALFRTVTAEAERFPELGRAFFETGPKCWTRSFEGYLRAQDEKGVLRIPHPEMAAKFLRSEEHTSELQSLMRISYAVFCLKKKNKKNKSKTNRE